MTYPADKVFTGSLGADTLVVGSGSNRAELTVISNSLQVNGVATTGVVSYTEFTSPVTTNTTTEASANTIVTAPALVADGVTTFMIEFYSPQIQPGTAASEYMIITLWDGATDLGWMGVILGGTGALFAAQTMKRRLTPTAASHTYSIRGHNSVSGNGSVAAGAGGIGTLLPGYIRIVRDS